MMFSKFIIIQPSPHSNYISFSQVAPVVKKLPANAGDKRDVQTLSDFIFAGPAKSMHLVIAARKLKDT